MDACGWVGYRHRAGAGAFHQRVRLGGIGGRLDTRAGRARLALRAGFTLRASLTPVALQRGALLRGQILERHSAVRASRATLTLRANVAPIALVPLWAGFTLRASLTPVALITLRTTLTLRTTHNRLRCARQRRRRSQIHLTTRHRIKHHITQLQRHALGLQAAEHGPPPNQRRHSPLTTSKQLHTHTTAMHNQAIRDAHGNRGEHHRHRPLRSLNLHPLALTHHWVEGHFAVHPTNLRGAIIIRPVDVHSPHSTLHRGVLHRITS